MPMRAPLARSGRHFRFRWPANRISLSGLTDPTLPGLIRFVCWPRFRKPAPLWVNKVWSSPAKPGLLDVRDSFCSPGGPIPVSVTSGAKRCRIIGVPSPDRPNGALHCLQRHKIACRRTQAIWPGSSAILAAAGARPPALPTGCIAGWQLATVNLVGRQICSPGGWARMGHATKMAMIRCRPTQIGYAWYPNSSGTIVLDAAVTIDDPIWRDVRQALADYMARRVTGGAIRLPGAAMPARLRFNPDRSVGSAGRRTRMRGSSRTLGSAGTPLAHVGDSGRRRSSALRRPNLFSK
jgi:hypothetical protein